MSRRDPFTGQWTDADLPEEGPLDRAVEAAAEALEELVEPIPMEDEADRRRVARLAVEAAAPYLMDHPYPCPESRYWCERAEQAEAAVFRWMGDHGAERERRILAEAEVERLRKRFLELPLELAKWEEARRER